MLENRLDVFAKKRVFDELKLGLKPDFTLYEQVIKARTGFKEKQDHFGPWKKKSSAEDYKRALTALYESMRKGYNKSFPIPVMRGRLLNGSHRLACCMSLGIDPVFKEVEHCSIPEDWGFDWFVKNNIDPMIALYEYAVTMPCSIYVLWGAYKEQWPEIERRLPLRVGSVEYALPSMEAVRDVYRANVSKAKKLPPDIRIVVCGEHDTRVPKEKLRAMVGDKRFLSLHGSENLSEARHIAHTLLSKNNIRLMDRKSHMLEGFTDETCVVGGVVRSLFSDHRPSDVDIIGKPVAGCDLIKNYRARYTDEQIISHPDLHFRVRGVKFCNPEIEQLKKRQK